MCGAAVLQPSRPRTALAAGSQRSLWLSGTATRTPSFYANRGDTNEKEPKFQSPILVSSIFR